MNAGLVDRRGSGRLVDTHCHLGLYPAIDQVLERSTALDVGIVVSSTRPSEYRSLVSVLPVSPGLEIGLGMHPEVAGSVYEQYEFEIFVRLAAGARWISEVGLDAGIAESAGPAFGAVPSIVAQSALFERLLGQLDETHCLSIHSRLAETEVLDHIQASKVRRGVLHNFMGERSVMARAVDLGLYFSINPWMFMTEQTRELITLFPLDRILLETDGPFSRWDDRPSEPADCIAVAEAVAELRRQPAEVIRDAVASNFVQLCEGPL